MRNILSYALAAVVSVGLTTAAQAQRFHAARTYYAPVYHAPAYRAPVYRAPVRQVLPGRPAIAGVPGYNTFNANPYSVSPYATLPGFQAPINPNYLAAPGLSYGQAAYNQSLQNYGNYANIPPYAFGYPTFNNFGPNFGNYGYPYGGSTYGGIYANPYGYYGGY